MLNRKNEHVFFRIMLATFITAFCLCACSGQKGRLNGNDMSGNVNAADDSRDLDTGSGEDVSSSGESETTEADKEGGKKEEDKEERTESTAAELSSLTDGQAGALRRAEQYLTYDAFSCSGLKEQLVSNGFSEADASYAVDHCGADWNEQAAIKARAYLEYSAFSEDGLIDQLLYEGFTLEQAQYGVANSEIDTSEMAKEAAASFLRYTPYSYSGEQKISEVIYGLRYKIPKASY